MSKAELEKFLSETAQAQWHADAPGGDVGKRQLEITRRKLAVIGLNERSREYLQAYEKARTDFR